MTYDENLLKAEQEKIQAVYTKIGERYYAAHKDDGNPEFADLVDEIKACEKTMSDHKAQVLRENGLMLCPRCGEEIYYKSVFCNFCGIRVVAPAEEKTAVEDIPVTEAPAQDMPVTEAPVEEIPVTEAPAEDMPVTEAPLADVPVTAAPAPEMSATEAPLEDVTTTEIPADAPEEKRCAKCGAVLEEGCRFCIECGAPVQEEAPAPAAPFEGSVRFCLACGYKVTDPEAMFCNNCGQRLEDAHASAIPTPAPKPAGKTCPFCGFTTTDPEVAFCIECGTRLP